MEFLQQNMIWVALAAVSGGMLLWPLVAGGGAETLTPAQATLLMNREDALVLDVRETGEWTSGHIPGARHITLAQLGKRMSELDKFKDKRIGVGDEIRARWEKDGKNTAKSFKKTAGC